MSCCTSAPIVTQTCETLLSKCEVPIIDLAHMGKSVAFSFIRNFPLLGLGVLILGSVAGSFEIYTPLYACIAWVERQVRLGKLRLEI